MQRFQRQLYGGGAYMSKIKFKLLLLSVSPLIQTLHCMNEDNLDTLKNRERQLCEANA